MSAEKNDKDPPTGTGTDTSGTKKLYSAEELKLRGGSAQGVFGYEVKLPKGMELPILSDKEKQKIQQKIADQESGLTDLEILKRDLQKVLDSM